MSSRQTPLTLSHMQEALAQARQAAAEGEIPVGAVVVAPDGEIILGKGHNRCIADHDPSAHAEIQALREAARTLGNYRLDGCTLYVTLEPCAMCSGAMLHARLEHVIYAVPDPRTGAAGSVLDLFAPSGINHQTTASLLSDTEGGLQLRQQCADLLTGFFRARRQQQAQQRQHAASAPLREDALRPSAKSLKEEGVLQPGSRWTLVPDPGTPTTAAWRVHHLEQGDPAAPTVVLLHGYAGHAGLWQELSDELAHAGWRTLAPDLPGHGLSDKPRQPALHSLPWHQAMLQTWLERQNLPTGWLLVTLDQAALLVPGDLPPSRVLALESGEAPIAWPDDPILASSDHTTGRAAAQDWRLRCQRSPRFDLPQHWALDDQPALEVLCQACYPDPGHRGALRWPLCAGQPPSADDFDWWQHRGRRLPVQPLEPAPVKLPQPGARIRAALRHNTPQILQWLEQHRAARSAS